MDPASHGTGSHLGAATARAAAAAKCSASRAAEKDGRWPGSAHAAQDPQPETAYASLGIFQFKTLPRIISREEKSWFISCQCVSYSESHGWGAGERNTGRAEGEEVILEMKRQETFPTFLSKKTEGVWTSNVVKLSFFGFIFLPYWATGFLLRLLLGRAVLCSSTGWESRDR